MHTPGHRLGLFRRLCVIHIRANVAISRRSISSLNHFRPTSTSLSRSVYHRTSPNSLCTVSSPARQRQYHSPSPSESHATQSPFSSTEITILSAALAHVPQHGFTHVALVHGCREAGYPEVSTNLFPRGAMDLIMFHLVNQRTGLGQKVQFPDANVSVGQKVRSLVRERLMGNAAIIGRWREAMAVMAQSANISASLQELHLLSDEIWHLAGDTSVDSSWYTRRATLSGIYASTEVFMTTDTSPNFAETEKFLDRRLEGLRTVGQSFGAVSEWVGFSGRALVNVLRSKGMRI